MISLIAAVNSCVLGGDHSIESLVARGLGALI